LTTGALLPTGARLTPTAAAGAALLPLDPALADRPDYRADHLASLALSPDGATLAGVTSGYNLENGADGKIVPAWSREYLFVWDGTTSPPTKTQAIPVANAFYGVAFAPKGDALYVSGGVDDSLHTYAKTASGAWAESGAPIALGHAA